MSDFTIYNRDSMKIREWMEPESVHLVVTSPPYWSIIDYGVDKQIGFGQTFEEYMCSLQSIFSQCAETLVPGGRMCINVGEQYLSTKEHGRYRVAPIPQLLVELMNTEYGKPKAGLDYMGSIVWNKIPTQNASGGGKWMGSTYWPTDIALAFEHEYILVFRKHGKREKQSEEVMEASKLTKEERGEWSRAMWRVPPERDNPHPAPFPIAIPERLIKLFSFVGDTVLDPFLGSGTTMEASAVNNRSCIGIELSEEFIDMAKARCQKLLFFDGKVKVR